MTTWSNSFVSTGRLFIFRRVEVLLSGKEELQSLLLFDPIIFLLHSFTGAGKAIMWLWLVSDIWYSVGNSVWDKSCISLSQGLLHLWLPRTPVSWWSLLSSRGGEAHIVEGNQNHKVPLHCPISAVPQDGMNKSVLSSLLLHHVSSICVLYKDPGWAQCPSDDGLQQIAFRLKSLPGLWRFSKA